MDVEWEVGENFFGGGAVVVLPPLLLYPLLLYPLDPTVESGEWEEPPVEKLMEFNYEVKSQVQARGYPLA